MTLSPFSLKDKHTFGLSAQCSQWDMVTSVEQLKRLISKLSNSPVLILGEGSNTVFVEDIPSTVLRIHLQGVGIQDASDVYKVNVAAGESWHHLVTVLLDKGIPGFENLALIPGTVGAAPIQNIGAYGVELAQYIDYVEFIDMPSGEVHQLSAKECEFGYRSSIFKEKLVGQCVITEVAFSLPKQWQPRQSYGPLAELNQPSAIDIYKAVIDIRRSKLPDPDVIGNAGSFFKNPVIAAEHFQRIQRDFASVPGYPEADTKQVKVPAAWLIEQCGFKGQERDGIGCHPTQPLVLTNLGQGTGPALLSFAREIRDTVAERFDIRLENEVRLVGAEGLIAL